MATAFSTELGVCPEIDKAIEEMDWLLPTDVQGEAIPLILGGGDVLMAAETGSGKTGAFVIPAVQIVHETLRDIRAGLIGGASSRQSYVNKWQFNPCDRDHAVAISADGCVVQSREMKKWQGTRATKGVTGKGKYYYEATVMDEGLCRVGWSTPDATLDLGTDNQTFGFGGTGKKSTQKQFDDYGEPFGLHDTVGCYIDLDSYTISYSKNGKYLGEAFKLSGSSLQSGLFFPAVVLKNAEMKFNFGDSDFRFPPSEDYIGLTSAQPKYICKTPNDASAGKNDNNTLKDVPNSPRALIIEPSRELAQQTMEQIVYLSKYVDNPKIRSLCVVGGVSAKEQLDTLQKGVDIVVGTPGRLDDFIQTSRLSLKLVRFFILDEADGLLSAGYTDLLHRIYNLIPKFSPDAKRLQMIVCSATLHSFDVKKLADKLMHFPVWVDLKGQDSVPDTVHHCVCIVDPKSDLMWQRLSSRIQTDGVHQVDGVKPGCGSPESLSEALKILKGEYCISAIRQIKMDQAIIFCRTKIDCDNLERYLLMSGGTQGRCANEFSCVCLHGDRRPQERKENLQLFKRGEVKFLICTDVAARGLDITGIPFVINVTLPDEKQNYVHRIGRVGRAERMGLAISLVSKVKEKVWYHSCPSRGKSCKNTNLKNSGGCCIWYDEIQYLADIEEHLGVTISQINSDMKIAVDEFDGKIIYGEKRRDAKPRYMNHATQLAPTVNELSILEKSVQSSFLQLKYANKLI